MNPYLVADWIQPTDRRQEKYRLEMQTVLAFEQAVQIISRQTYKGRMVVRKELAEAFHNAGGPFGPALVSAMGTYLAAESLL